eukprot:m.417314 g.417314  ORF g.417314 m.417314 type:complete len:314 (+) comp16833_c0_seq15:452-1393(+)
MKDETTVSDAYRGNEITKLIKPTAFPIELGKVALMDNAIADGVNESDVMAHVFPPLNNAIRTFDHTLRVFDSQRARFLTQADTQREPRYNLGPDGYVASAAVGEDGKGPPSGPTSGMSVPEHLRGLKEPPLGHTWYLVIRSSLIEGKEEDAWGKTAIGQAERYSKRLKLGHPILHVLLIDRKKWRAVVCVRGVVTSFTDGFNTDAGSQEFIGKFLLGGGSIDTPHVPYVSRIELALNAALPVWEEAHGLVPCQNRPVAGIGLSGVVLRIMLLASKTSPVIEPVVAWSRPMKHTYFWLRRRCPPVDLAHRRDKI